MKNKRLKIALLATLSVIMSYGTSFGKYSNYGNYSSGRHYRNELSYLDYDDDEFYYRPHLAEMTEKGLYLAPIAPISLFTLHTLSGPSDSNAESHVDSDKNQLKSESNENVKKDQSAENDNRLKNENNANMISFADGKKEIDKISLRNIGNTCYMNTFVQTVLQFPNLVGLIKDIKEDEINTRLKDCPEEYKKALLGLHKLILDLSSGNLTNQNWNSYARLMGWDGNMGVANRVWEIIIGELLPLYYENMWEEKDPDDPQILMKRNVRWCGIEKCTLLFKPTNIERVAEKNIVKDKLNVVDLLKTDLNTPIPDKDDKPTNLRHRICANNGTFQIDIPSLSGGKKLDDKKMFELTELEDNFEEFELEAVNEHSIGIDFNKTVKRAKFTLKSIMLRVGFGHWYSISKNNDGYYLHNDSEIRKIDKNEVIDKIKSNPVGATFMYSVSEIK